ncbi:MAG: ComEA family DNA-binding protein, partial [Desulfomonilaceae bacterium]
MGLKALHGLAMIEIVCVLGNIFWLGLIEEKLSSELFSPETETNDCGYQIINKDSVIGTVFFKRRATVQEISEAIGTKNLSGFGAGQVFPCGSILIFDNNGNALDVRRLSGAQLVACGKKIELNSSTEADFQSVPGVGPSIAKKIEQYKRSFGPFESPSDLAKIKG